jgi:hypothetical protein
MGNILLKEGYKNSEKLDFVPVVSDNIADFISNKISEINFTNFVEYGAGSSTIYYLKKILEAKKTVNYISMEYNSYWFLNTVETIKSEFGNFIKEAPQLNISPWTYEKCKKYFKSKNMARFKIPDSLKRLPKGKKKIAGILRYKMFIYRFLQKYRPFDGIFFVEIDRLIKFYFYLKTDFIKDQYGESPLKKDYIYSPFKHFLQDIENGKDLSIMFLIDGGSRSDILKSIFDVEDKYNNFFPVIFLCDANRIFYNDQIKRRNRGIYLRGTNRTLNNKVLYGDRKRNIQEKMKFTYGNEKITLKELIEKELWYYSSIEPEF